MPLPSAREDATPPLGPSDRPGTTASPVGPPLIVLPTLNEEEGLRATLKELAAVGGFPEATPPAVLVVDGHSSDSTPAVAVRFGCRLLPQSGRGKGAAVRDGLAWAVENGYGTVAVLDADGTYPCDQLPAMLRLLERGADVVAGVRQPTERSGSTPRNLVHRVGNGALNTWAAFLSRGPILDVCTGFWGVRSSVVRLLGLESTGFEVESELFVKAMRHRLRFAQIPVEYRPRIGDAKLHAVRDGVRIWISIARHSVRAFPAPPGAPGALADVPRDSPLARALPTVLAAFPAAPILIVTGPSRYPEAVQVVRSVGACRPSIPVAVRLSSPESESRNPPWTLATPAPFGENAPVVVTLPEPDGAHAEPGAAFVHVPSAGRTLRVEGGEAPSPPTSAMRARLEGDRATVRRLRAPGALRILSATFDTSGVQKQLVLLASNSARARIRVSAVEEGDVGPPDGPAPVDSSFPSIPIPPGVTGSR
ncbi:MAG: glycosyltransferase [Thermoplasmata archaeon]|nr:glycosyltransferase [Thermoplasmata archaeon]